MKNRDFLPLFAKRKISPIFYNLRGGVVDIREKGSFSVIIAGFINLNHVVFLDIPIIKEIKYI